MAGSSLGRDICSSRGWNRLATHSELQQSAPGIAAVGNRDVLPFTALVTMECINVGLNTLFKAATVHGMSHHVFVVYAYAVVALVLLPSPFFSRRSTELPPLNSSIACKIFLLGLIGCTSQILGYTGISYSSPTLASAISNLVPAFTFILALIFRGSLKKKRPGLVLVERERVSRNEFQK